MTAGRVANTNAPVIHSRVGLFHNGVIFYQYLLAALRLVAEVSWSHACAFGDLIRTSRESGN